MSNTLIVPTLTGFLYDYGEELEMCNEDAYLDLVRLEKSAEIDESELKAVLMKHADELDACHPEAFDILYDLGLKLGIQI